MGRGSRRAAALILLAGCEAPAAAPPRRPPPPVPEPAPEPIPPPWERPDEVAITPPEEPPAVLPPSPGEVRPAASADSAGRAPAALRPPIPPSRKPDGDGWWCSDEAPRKREGTCFRDRASCERLREAARCVPRNTSACFAILNTSERLCFIDAAACEAAVRLLPEEMPLSACETGG